MNRSKQLLSQLESKLIVEDSVRSYLKIAELDLLESVLEDVSVSHSIRVTFKYESNLTLDVGNLREDNFVKVVNELQRILEDSGLDIIDTFQSDSSYKMYLQLSEELCQDS